MQAVGREREPQEWEMLLDPDQLWIIGGIEDLIVESITGNYLLTSLSYKQEAEVFRIPPVSKVIKRRNLLPHHLEEQETERGGQWENLVWEREPVWEQ